MDRKRVAFTWQVLSDDAEQDDRMISSFGAQDGSVPSQTARPARRWWWGLLGLALIVAAAAGYRLYRTAQTGVEVLETELQAAVARESRTTPKPVVAAKPASPVLQSFDLWNGVAAVEVVANDPSLSLPTRKLRFFRQTESGWQPTAADASFWGSRRRLESQHFIFHYRRRDHAAVLAAAPALDAFYTRLHQDLGRGAPNAGEKVIVEVFASYGLEDSDLPAATIDPFRVPSPGLLQIPVDVSDAEVLALSVSITLVYRLLPGASADWLATGDHPTGWWWPPLTEGLRLWLLWDNVPLLARWRHDILTWYLANSCQACSRQSQTLPAGYREFCQMLMMLGLYPPHLSISPPCTETFGDADGNTYYFSPPSRPAQLSSLATLSRDTTPARMETDLLQMSYGGQVMSMATLLEYVADTYERERIPVLLAAFGAHERWDTLVPAVFGISAEEFEAGWRSYLQEKYGMAGL